MKNESNIIRMSFHLDAGLPGVDDDPDNPIARAARNLMIDGKPYKKMSLCFYTEQGGEKPGEKDTLKWFGTFILSSTRRIIFFPGFNFTPAWIKEAKKQSSEKYRKIQIDHITLEKNLDKWHYTSSGSKNHYGKGRTIYLGENRFLWFGMSLASSSFLKNVKEDTIYEIAVPETDATRRMNIFMNSREGVVFNNLLLHPEAQKRFKQYFIHFTVIVGKKGFSEHVDPMLGAPYGSPYIEDEPKFPLTKIPLRSHRISFNSDVEIEIITSCLAGTLTEKMIFSCKTSV